MKTILGTVAVVIVAIAIVGAYKSPQVQRNFGALVGPTILDGLELLGGVTSGRTYSTSTTLTTQTLVAADIAGQSGFAHDTVIITPNTGTVALTLPATSTLRYFLPSTGQTATQCWFNASSTANINVTFAAGAGIILQSATSTSGGIGAPTIAPLDLGCFRYMRQPDTDISAAFTTYKDAD